MTNDMADMTQEKIMKAAEEVDEVKRSEAMLANNFEVLRTRLIELEKRNENEIAAATRENNKLTSERSNAERSLEVLKNASFERNANLRT